MGLVDLGFKFAFVALSLVPAVVGVLVLFVLEFRFGSVFVPVSKEAVSALCPLFLERRRTGLELRLAALLLFAEL